jgi:alanyl-tRNA synthetase
MIVPDPDCQWSDGEIGGYCSELYCGDLEIGNLVNTMEHSVDVGFGLERMVQVYEGKSRVDDTSLFRHDSHPIVRDHSRTLECLWSNGIRPGCKGREFVCQKLLRRMVPHLNGEKFVFGEWLDAEVEKRRDTFERVRNMLKKHKHRGKPAEWWIETTGLSHQELRELGVDA